jgi:hypothetical protein
MSLKNALSKMEVTPFTLRKTLARSRKRNEALSVIVPHILGALAAYGRARRWGNDIIGTRSRKGQYVIASCAIRSGLYFAVWENDEQRITGFINPDRPGRYLGGRVHVMTWQRGPWEADLLSAFRSAPLPIER